ncbi:STAS/SEC14 domain-containing protein [Rufibacter roseolus]|uniref:STAS/SEC14 domain-containing protein n=1 Tax=Rufibacter roseolus TaxID=2817375 RepID=UPI001B312143|nr:STAS/SEC14 domain-containing protein [Rufibacter roseolus]
MRKIYYQTTGLTLSYDEDHATAYAVWNGFLASPELREAVLQCLELMESKGITRWLADNRKMKAIRQADQQWFLSNVIPRMLQSSLRRMATLVSEDMFNKMAVEQLLQRAGNLDHLAMRDFNDEKEALEWLMAPFSVSSQVKS